MLFVKRKWKFVVLIAIFIFLLYNSFYFQNLKEKRAEQANKEFNAEQYARNFWDELSERIDKAADAKQFLMLFRLDPKKAIENYSTKAKHVSSTHFFLLQGEGRIISATKDGVLICLTETEVNPEILIATDLIFGAAVRNASGLVDSDDFPDSMNYNKVSEEINNIVIKQMIPPFKDKARQGSIVYFVGAAEIFESDPQISPLRVIPIKLELK
jgi:predicted lipoprotein